MVDAELIFNDVISLPNTSSVAETLVAAASSSNFSLSVNTSSIVATSKSLYLMPAIQYMSVHFSNSHCTHTQN